MMFASLHLSNIYDISLFIPFLIITYLPIFEYKSDLTTGNFKIALHDNPRELM